MLMEIRFLVESVLPMENLLRHLARKVTGRLVRKEIDLHDVMATGLQDLKEIDRQGLLVTDLLARKEIDRKAIEVVFVQGVAAKVVAVIGAKKMAEAGQVAVVISVADSSKFLLLAAVKPLVHLAKVAKTSKPRLTSKGVAKS